MKLGRVGLLTAAVIVAISTAALPALASPATGTITITSVGDPWDNAGLVTVGISAPTDVTSITAHIMDSGTDVLDLSDFTVISGTAQNGVWGLSSPITENQLALGVYAVTVDVSDTAGDAATGSGSIEFTVHPTITQTLNPSDFTYLQQTAQLSGTVTGLWPDGTTGPLSGIPVYITDVGGTLPPDPPILVGVTASDGTYSGTVAPDFTTGPTSAPDWFDTYINSTSTITGTTSASGEITPEGGPVTLTASITPAHIIFGQGATLSGTAMFGKGPAAVPVVGDTIMINNGNYQATETTGTDGTFSFTLPVSATPSWSVFAHATSRPAENWFFNASKGARVTVALPMSFTSFTARLTGAGYVMVNACLHTDVTSSAVHRPVAKVEFEYSPSPNGPWSELGTTATETGRAPGCGLPRESAAVAKLPGRLVNAYYRAVLNPTANFQEAVTGVVHSWLYQTKITGLRVSPSSVTRGGTATISGRLSRQDKTGWSAYSARRVAIIYRLPGRKTWYLLHRCLTHGSGKFHLKFIDNASADLRAIYLGDAKHLWSASAIIAITAHASELSSPSAMRLTPVPMPAWLRRATNGRVPSGPQRPRPSSLFPV